MKHLLILSLFLTSCSSVWHVNKAIQKGYTPEKETIEIERLELRTVFDSILGELRVDTIRTTETRTIYQDRPLTRWETRLIRDTVKIYQRAETRQKQRESKSDIEYHKIKAKLDKWRLKKENRSFWWVWFVAGVCVGVFRKKIFALIKTKLLPLLHLRP
jgi:hypothetical protein